MVVVGVVAAARGVEVVERRMVVVGRGDAPDDGEEVAGLGGDAWVVVGSDGVGRVGGDKVVVDVGVGSGKPMAVAATAADRGLERRVDADTAVVAGAGCRAYRQAEGARQPCGAEEERSVEGGEHSVAARAEEGRRGDMAVLGDTERDARCKEASRPERWVPNSQGRAEDHERWGHRADDTVAERSLNANRASVAATDLSSSPGPKFR